MYDGPQCLLVHVSHIGMAFEISQHTSATQHNHGHAKSHHLGDRIQV